MFMKKLLPLLVSLPLLLFAESFLISDIPIPKTYIQNLDPYPCDEQCLQELIDNEMIFSFLAHAPTKLQNKEQDEIRMMSVNILNLGSSLDTDKLRIALLLPYKVIGRYASSTTNASFAYLLAKNHSFELKSYQLETQEIGEIQTVLEQIREDGFSYVIAPLTQTGADAITQIDPELYIYFPTIHKKDITHASPFLFYGGIDYKAQSDLLLKEAVSPLVIFHDDSVIGTNLTNYEEERFRYKDVVIQEEKSGFLDFSEKQKSIEKVLDEEKEVIKYVVPRNITNLERQLKENESIVNGSFFINTPVVKTGMIMSQLTLYDTNATNILSTQINYDPLLLSMTQFEDRKNMIVANSITQHNNIFIETNALLGNDIVYDWINYTTTVGIDYFFHMITNENREYNILVQENQMLYDIELLKPSLTRFVKHISAFK